MRKLFVLPLFGLILAGADEAMAAAEEPITERPAVKKKTEKRPALAGRVG